MKMLRLIFLFVATSRLSYAQNIDRENPERVFRASGSSENFDSEEAINKMYENARMQCLGIGLPKQLSPTILRTSYSYRVASASFNCTGPS